MDHIWVIGQGTFQVLFLITSTTMCVFDKCLRQTRGPISLGPCRRLTYADSQLSFCAVGHSQGRHHTVPAAVRQGIGVRRAHPGADHHRHRVPVRYTDRQHRQPRTTVGHVPANVLRVRQPGVRAADAVAHAQLEAPVQILSLVRPLDDFLLSLPPPKPAEDKYTRPEWQRARKEFFPREGNANKPILYYVYYQPLKSIYKYRPGGE